MSERRLISKIFFLLAGLLIWAGHFGAVYAFNATACARAFAGLALWGVGIVPAVVGVLTLAALAADIAVLVLAQAGRGPGIAGATDPATAEFWRFATMALAGLSLVAVAWAGLPALVVPPCG